MSIKIITDSACDILQKDGEKLGIEILPLKCIFGDEEYLDGVSISHEEFFDKLTSTGIFPRTSQINPFTYDDCFKKYKDDDVIVICLSSKVSGCYQSALIAASDYPNVKVVDSENMCIGEQVLVKYAIKLVKQGKKVDQIVNLLNKKKKDIVVLAVLDTLEYLKKGGRISSTVAFAGTLLNIKPVISIIDGKVALLGKARGSKNGNNFLRRHELSCGGIDFSMPYCVAYSGRDNSNLLSYLEDSKDLYPCSLDEVPVSTIGATIGTYCGPGTFGVAFFKNKI